MNSKVFMNENAIWWSFCREMIANKLFTGSKSQSMKTGTPLSWDKKWTSLQDLLRSYYCLLHCTLETSAVFEAIDHDVIIWKKSLSKYSQRKMRILAQSLFHMKTHSNANIPTEETWIPSNFLSTKCNKYGQINASVSD